MCVKKKIPVDNFDICLSVKKKKKNEIKIEILTYRVR